MNAVLIVIMMCGSIDTVIVKLEGETAIFEHGIVSEKMVKTVAKAFDQKLITITYTDDRDTCV